MRKRIVSLLMACVALTACYNANESRDEVLKVYNWADYIGEGVLEDFQQYYKEQTGKEVRIVYQTFDINEIMLTKIEKGHEDFDVVCPSEYTVWVCKSAFSTLNPFTSGSTNSLRSGSCCHTWRNMSQLSLS